jgi:hypothetical protein
LVTEKRLPVEDDEQFSKGGFQGIKKVRGLLTNIEITDAPDTWDNADKKDVVEVTLEDAVVLEMFEGEEPFDLTDGKFTFLLNYAKKGQNPSDNSTYKKGWVDSAKKLGKAPSSFIGEYVTLEKMEIELFPYTDKETKEKKIATGKCFCFVGDEALDSESIKSFLRGHLHGKDRKSVLRSLLSNQKAKQFPELRDMHKADTLAEYLDMVVEDGIYLDPEVLDEDSAS